MPGSMAGWAWVGLTPAALVILAAFVFVLQNRQDSTVSFAAFSGRIPLGVALLAEAALGALAVFLLGSLRILHHRIHRYIAWNTVDLVPSFTTVVRNEQSGARRSHPNRFVRFEIG